MERFTVDESEAGSRLDRLVADRLDVARNQVQGWIRDGLVTVDGEPQRTSYQVGAGDQVACSPRSKNTAANLLPEEGDLDILHESEHLIVLDKPAGLAVHPGAGRPDGTLVNRLLRVYPELATVGGNDRPGIVHRLDIDTTGVIIIARTEAAYQGLTRAFAERRVAKSYLALTFGTPRPAAGRIDQPLGRHPSKRTEMAVREDGRPARTTYRTLAAGTGVSLLEVDLETGRTHQIRVHLKAVGCPLVGDVTYAGARWRSAPREVQRVLADFPRPALHAARLGCDHPVTGVALDFEAPLPRDLVELWSELSPEPLSRLAAAGR